MNVCRLPNPAMRLYLLLCSLMWLPFISLAQPGQQGEQPERTEVEKYEWRLRQDVLYDVYIPKDINEVLLELNKKMDEPSKAKFKLLTEQEAATRLFFSLGRWMTHNWGLYEGSRLSKHMQATGIHHPDDMVRFFIIVYHRSLNKKPLEVKELIQNVAEVEEKRKQERMHRGTILYEEKKKVQSPPSEKN